MKRANQLVADHCLRAAGLQHDAYGQLEFIDAKSCTSAPSNYFNTAADLDTEGNQLNFSRALAGPDGAIWLAKHGEEIDRLFASETMRLIYRHHLPADKKPAYYNP